MAANWASGTDPQLSSTYTNVINSIRERDEDVAKQFNTPSTNALLGTNHVTGTIRWDGANSKWKLYDGTDWDADLASTYDINVATVSSCAPNNASGANNLPRNNGTLQNNLISNYLGASSQDAAFFRNASNLNAGTIANARLPSSISSDITGNSATFSVSANNSTNETTYPLFVDGATGPQGAESDTGFTYNPSSGALTATSFVGSGTSLTGISSTIQTEIDTKAELAGSASQAFSATTASANTNTTQVATTAFVQTESATKAELAGSASQTFSASTASANTNSTRVATTAFVQTAVGAVDLSTVYPVGSIYMNASSGTNPATLLGFGTWSAFGGGRVLVGLTSSDEDFNTVEETGGSKTHTLTTNEIPSHRHQINHSNQGDSFGGTPSISVQNGNPGKYTMYEGGGASHNNVQPYITVYMWKRTN